MAPGDAGNTVDMAERSVIAGLGCRGGSSLAEVLAALDSALARYSRGRCDVALMTTISQRSGHPAISAAAAALRVPLLVPDEADLLEANERALTRSQRSLAAVGLWSASEAAALAAAGPGGLLLGPRTVHGGVACALASRGLLR